jgi:DNA invertase Pin-like site-specific DNA recombinase
MKLRYYYYMKKGGPPTERNIEGKILKILSERIVSTSQLAKELGIKRYILTGYLEALKNQGKLEFYRVGKSNVYVPKGWKK